ncbi:MAG: hypothetical protein KME13_26815 [Myxacorys californica WJT36-NPBG1]|jgi:hypothetical protein|nr:hypothetical protein [Myxacorys californica WJT36-NPBG1]
MQYEWIDKHKAGEIVNAHADTLKRWRSNPHIGWIEGIHYQKVGRQILYNEQLLRDWMAHRHDTDGHLAAIEGYQRTLTRNQPKRRKSA